MKRTNHRVPGTLVRWASQAKVGIRQAADRPWRAIPPPPVPVEAWEHCCARDGTTVALIGYATRNVTGFVYLGQCCFCETIYWAMGGRCQGPGLPTGY